MAARKNPEGPVNGRRYPGARKGIGGSWLPDHIRPRVTYGPPPKPPRKRRKSSSGCALWLLVPPATTVTTVYLAWRGLA